MKRRDKEVRDVDECLEKIDALLQEYNCKIEFDGEMECIIVVDDDTLEFVKV